MYTLITGAAGGLGRAFAAECASRGYDLLLTDMNAAGLETVRRGLLRQYTVCVHTKTCDITRDADVGALMEYAREFNIHPTMLLNVAGIDHEGGFTQRGFEQISDILRVNIEATLRITHQTLALRQKERVFHVVFVSSLASLYPMPLKATYAASKRFLLDFSYALGQELKADHVKVLSLCPGGLSTTQDALNGIAAQGFWGSLTTNRLECVVHRTIDRVQHGRHIYIPGVLNRIFSIFGRFLPSEWITRIVFSRWREAQKHWLAIQ